MTVRIAVIKLGFLNSLSAGSWDCVGQVMALKWQSQVSMFIITEKYSVMIGMFLSSETFVISLYIIVSKELK